MKHHQVALAALPDERRRAFNGGGVEALRGLERRAADANAGERAAGKVDADAGA
jgi:hypothetical protein